MEKNNPFKVPDNYFNDFKLEIMGKLPENKFKKKKLLFSNSIMKWSTIAAVILIFIFIGFGYVDNHNKHFSNNTQPNQQDVNVVISDQQYVALQNDYYLFVEDQAEMSMYREALNSDDL